MFTSAQADAFGVPRYALSYAAKASRIESPFQGAYRIAASPDDGYAELAALWMLTKPTVWRRCSEAEKLAAEFFSALLGMPGEKLAWDRKSLAWRAYES